MVSTASDAEIEWCMNYYDQIGMWAQPHKRMRCHIFNYGAPFRVPGMVTSHKLVALGVDALLYPYYKALLEWFDLAPLQLSPSIYKLAAALLILYNELGFDPPFMAELSYFFSLRASII